MKEVWRQIAGYEGLYEVSTFGNIRRAEDHKRVNPQTTSKGYLRVGLFKNKSRKWYKVHRIVAQAFLPNPGNKPQINHRDFNKKNNRVWNLEWVTDEENKRYSEENSFETERTVTENDIITAMADLIIKAAEVLKKGDTA